MEIAILKVYNNYNNEHSDSIIHSDDRNSVTKVCSEKFTITHIDIIYLVLNIYNVFQFMCEYYVARLVTIVR